MRVAARVLMLVLLPALAEAQSSPYPAAQQGAATGSGAMSEIRAGDALAALKLQTSHQRQTTRPTLNPVDAQVSFRF